MPKSRGSQVMRKQMYRTKIAFFIACVFKSLFEENERTVSSRELAEMIGCSQENAWRHITQLQLEGFIDLIILEGMESTDGIQRGNLVVNMTGHKVDIRRYYDYTYKTKWLKAAEERFCGKKEQQTELHLVVNQKAA